MHDSKERHDAPKCHENTRKAIIKDITSWIRDDSKDSLILWISAPAGSGKSAILQTIAERFHASGGLAASFFFSRAAAQRRTETYLIATIASQLAMSIPSTKPFIEQAMLDNLAVFDKALSIQMTHLITQPLIKASLQAGRSSPWPSLLIIDGLDECNGEKVQADILHILNGALVQLKSSLPTIYLLIASRPEPAICDVFLDKLSAITHHLVLDNSYNPDRDIATFLRSSFADIYHRRRTRFPSMSSLTMPWPSERVISFLVQKSSGQFIFAATVIRFIDEDRKLPTSQLQLILDICQSPDASQRGTNPFALLDQLYAHTLKSSKELDRVRSFLGAIFYLEGRRAPTPYFLEALLGLSPDELALSFWDLHSIIDIPDFKSDPIRFYHASFRDFLVDPHRSEHLQIDEHAAHSLLLKSCMRHLPDAPTYRMMCSIVEEYSRDFWWKHYSRGNSIKKGSLDSLLQTFKPNPGSFSASTSRTRLIYWWSIYGRVRRNFHRQVRNNCYLNGNPFIILPFCSAIPRTAPPSAADLIQCLTTISCCGLESPHGRNQPFLCCGYHLHLTTAT